MPVRLRSRATAAVGVKMEEPVRPLKRVRRSTVKAEPVDPAELPVHVKTEVVVKEEIKVEQSEYTKPTTWEPKNWREIYAHVKEMRAKVIAPVDTMGCERLPEGVSSTITPQVFRYQLLVALMLSSQTKDEVNAQAMEALRQGLKPVGGLTVGGILATPERDIDAMICKVGFHNRKAAYIKATTQILRDSYGDDVPNTVVELCALPGVGPKMSHLLMHRAWGIADGIGVDVHLHRLANMWGWTAVKGANKKLAPTPERTREALESWLPKELWIDINPLLVGFGQTICLPRGSKCEQCTLATAKLCRGVDRARIKKMAALKAKEPVKCEETEINDIEDLV